MKSVPRYIEFHMETHERGNAERLPQLFASFAALLELAESPPQRTQQIVRQASHRVPHSKRSPLHIPIELPGGIRTALFKSVAHFAQGLFALDGFHRSFANFVAPSFGFGYP